MGIRGCLKVHYHKRRARSLILKLSRIDYPDKVDYVRGKAIDHANKAIEIGIKSRCITKDTFYDMMNIRHYVIY